MTRKEEKELDRRRAPLIVQYNNRFKQKIALMTYKFCKEILNKHSSKV
jgi:hypothetical protein